MPSKSKRSQSSKEPGLAVSLNSLLPGLGYFYIGAIWRGVLIGAVALLLLFLRWTWPLHSTPGPLFGFSALFLLIPLQLVAWFDVYRIARQRNSSEFQRNRRPYRDPWLAVFWSTIFIGFGHVYARRWGCALFLLFLSILGSELSEAGKLGWSMLLGAIDAGQSYRFLKKQLASQEHKLVVLPQHSAFWVIILVTLISLPSSLLASTVGYSSIYPFDNYMFPTLKSGDRIVYSKIAYSTQLPQRGDVIVFSATPEVIDQRSAETVESKNFDGYPTDGQMLQRIIALPEETIELRQGQVRVNGELLIEPYVKVTDKDSQWGPEKVPPNHYFVLGDTRNKSFDSRYWGFLPEEAIFGKVTKRMRPLHRVGSLSSN